MDTAEAQHLIRLEFYGYHVFNEDYYMLTPVQALFLDIGLSQHWNRMFGSDEDVKNLKHRNVKRF